MIIDNPSFIGFLPPSNSKSSYTVQIYKLSIKDISIRHLQGKHFPIVFNTIQELTLENYHANGGFRSFDDGELAQSFPKLRFLKIFSRSIQHIVPRMFQHFTQLEYLILDGITAIENEAFLNLYHLKELNLGKHILRIDPYAFIHMSTNNLLLNQSHTFQLNDEKHFCAFAQFVPSTDLKTFVQFSNNLTDCSCTLRYLYRHLDKSFMSLTPNCYSNSSLYILTQEERICHFEQRILQCDILPDEGITIYGKYYNVSHFYQQQISKQRNQFSIFFQHRIYYIVLLPVVIIVLCLIIRQQKLHHDSTYRYLDRLLKRRRLSRNVNLPTMETFDMIYHQTNHILDPIPSRTSVVTKV